MYNKETASIQQQVKDARRQADEFYEIILRSKSGTEEARIKNDWALQKEKPKSTTYSRGVDEFNNEINDLKLKIQILSQQLQEHANLVADSKKAIEERDKRILGLESRILEKTSINSTIVDRHAVCDETISSLQLQISKLNMLLDEYRTENTSLRILLHKYLEHNPSTNVLQNSVTETLSPNFNTFPSQSQESHNENKTTNPLQISSIQRPATNIISVPSEHSLSREPTSQSTKLTRKSPLPPKNSSFSIERNQSTATVTSYFDDGSDSEGELGIGVGALSRFDETSDDHPSPSASKKSSSTSSETALALSTAATSERNMISSTKGGKEGSEEGFPPVDSSDQSWKGKFLEEKGFKEYIRDQEDGVDVWMRRILQKNTNAINPVTASLQSFLQREMPFSTDLPHSSHLYNPGDHDYANTEEDGDDNDGTLGGFAMHPVKESTNDLRHDYEQLRSKLNNSLDSRVVTIPSVSNRPRQSSSSPESSRQHLSHSNWQVESRQGREVSQSRDKGEQGRDSLELSNNPPIHYDFDEIVSEMHKLQKRRSLDSQTIGKSSHKPAGEEEEQEIEQGVVNMNRQNPIHSISIHTNNGFNSNGYNSDSSTGSKTTRKNKVQVKGVNSNDSRKKSKDRVSSGVGGPSRTDKVLQEEQKKNSGKVDNTLPGSSSKKGKLTRYETPSGDFPFRSNHSPSNTLQPTTSLSTSKRVILPSPKGLSDYDDFSALSSSPNKVDIIKSSDASVERYNNTTNRTGAQAKTATVKRPTSAPTSTKRDEIKSLLPKQQDSPGRRGNYLKPTKCSVGKRWNPKHQII